MNVSIKTLEQAKKLFQHDTYATETTGIIIEEAKKNYAKCSMYATSRHMNANNTVMGGALFTLADFTFAIASNFDSPLTVSLTSQITYLNPASQGLLVAEAICEKNGRRTCTFTITITDANEKNIAIVSATGIRG